ncbi:MAG: FecR domain-containing protein [Bacteroidota bacterium]
MKERQLKKLLRKYGDHSASDAENYLVDSWYRSFDLDKSETVPGIVNPGDEIQTRQRILSGISKEDPKQIWYRSPLMAVACTMLIFLTAALIFQLNLRKQSAAQVLVFNTLQGQTKKILLSDSSVVWLNGNSRLEIGASYADSNRTVKLAGEAYFEVTHNPKKPFLVETQHITTKVLGTTFNVRAYQNSRFAKITLLTGRIWVKIKETQIKGVVLNPNQMLQYDQISHQSMVTNEQASLDQKAWTLGKLKFSNTPMEEVREILFQSHGLQISLDPGALSHARIYGEFKVNDDPEYIIRTLCKLIHAKYTLNGKMVMIRNRS